MSSSNASSPRSAESSASGEAKASVVPPDLLTPPEDAPALGPRPEQVEATCECQVCGRPKHRSEVYPANLVRPGVLAVIKKDHPDFSPDGCICLDDLNRYRSSYARDMLKAPHGFSTLQKQVIDQLGTDAPSAASDAENEFEQTLTFGERLADRIAELGGSWTFLICFAVVLIVWMAINSFDWFGKPFDPYPFILLNLALSCLAAAQAPVIMMSQNRQEERDRVHAEHDYRVNLKAELEIRHLHAKLDMLMTEQWRRLLEVQQTQLELIAAAKEKLEEAEVEVRRAESDVREAGRRVEAARPNREPDAAPKGSSGEAE